MISYLDAHPRATPKPDLTDQPPLIRALQICAQVAQLAHKKGYQWHSVTSIMNHQWKRNVLSLAHRKRANKREELQRCPACKLFYITSISWLRCQCKVSKPTGSGSQSLGFTVFWHFLEQSKKFKRLQEAQYV
jgi:hypothetical protein